MAKHGKSGNVMQEEQGNTGDTAKKRGPRRGHPRGPVITWNRERDRALGAVIASGTTQIDDIVSALREHAAFADVAEIVTRPRVHARIVGLKKQGVKFPRMAVRRAGGKIDVDGLNALLGVQTSEAEAGAGA